ncbi:MAG: quinoprotein glucose dehydrogenase [Saprospiraceae bacterium]|jgi:quinoprotein glucose dehydrogenase
MKALFFFYFGIVLLCFGSCNDQDIENEYSSKIENTKATDYSQWSSYLGGSDRNHFTQLDQISKDNIQDLQVAWIYSAPDSGQMQMNPIIVDSLLYGVSAGLKVFAIHAGTGKELWTYGNTEIKRNGTSRGVSYWTEGEESRILYTAGSELIALNRLSGELISSFGKNGRIDLRHALPEISKDYFVVSNTPGSVYENLIVMPLRVSEGADAAPGYIVAYDVYSGKEEWKFRTIPEPGEYGYETWEMSRTNQPLNIGGANNWAGMSVDQEEGIIFIPTGSASPDFYGGGRKGSNLFANCLLALNAATGERLWHFQFTHHDLWDRDLPAPPNLITITRDGKKIKAVAQITKSGYVFLFDRLTGEPLFDVAEIPVPPSTLVGEEAWTTQPIPVLPKPFARQSTTYSKSEISPYADNQDELLSILGRSKMELYATPDTQPVFLFPGYDGAGEWGGAGADPDAGVLYVNSNEMAWIMQMEELDNLKIMTASNRLYESYCSSCHRSDRAGYIASGYPSLINLENRLSRSVIENIIIQGKGMMTGFPNLENDERDAIMDYILGEKDGEEKLQETVSNIPLYRHMGYNKFLDSNGLPAITPPWGTIHAIDMNSGDYIWSQIFGDTPALKEQGMPPTGCESYGGPIVTANGLLIIAGTKDGYIRILDRKDGKTLWEYKLPFAGFATPSTYMLNGKQYIVIACGGEKLGTPKGNKIVAFALPD